MVEKEFARPYAKRCSAQAIFKWLPEVASVAEALPNDPQTARMVETWSGLLAALAEGKLLAGTQPIECTAEELAEWTATLKSSKEIAEGKASR